MKKINIVGLGYVGLPAALRLANVGYEVIGTDIDSFVIEELESNKKNFDEPGMDTELANALSNGIQFSSSCVETDFYIVAVPTNFIKETKKIDPRHLISAVSNILDVCRKQTIVVIESTITPGTIEKYLLPLTENTKKNIKFAHAPERIIPGNTLNELRTNSRILGADDEKTKKIVRNVYASFCKGEIMTTNLKTAELTKVIENTFRDVNIAFANELKKLCQKMGVDVSEVIKLANRHPRVNILQPGSGVGGHCISVDPWFLVGDYPEDSKLIHTARNVNDSMPFYEWQEMRKSYEGKRIGVYGLTYKPDVKDVRESPGLQLITALSDEERKQAIFFDPYILENIVENQVQDFYTFVNQIDVCLVMTNHSHIKEHLDVFKDKKVTIYDPFYCINGAKKI